MKPLLLLSLMMLSADVQRPSKVSHEERFERTFRKTAETPYEKVVIDNLAGGISVEGYEGDEILLVVRQRYEAESQVKLKEAREEIRLEIEERKDRLIMYVDAPWRERWGKRHGEWNYYGYEAEFEFELKVPKKTALYLRTVQEGDILMKNTHGDFDIRNVNGGIEAKDVSGSGRMYTVNGPVKSSFTKIPPEDCSFKTVNGKIELEFPGELAAELRFQTFNGDVFTDFEVESASRRILPIESRRGRKVYYKDASFGVRVRKGGPTLFFETRNGNIYILKRAS
ncbi:MAG: DUF4097 family beta strand repeat protein [Ignavibacteriales bacterium]|nr:DUF4097 family beta strand repeat protein [Ignavibacteriales bacterium]